MPTLGVSIARVQLDHVFRVYERRALRLKEFSNNALEVVHVRVREWLILMPNVEAEGPEPAGLDELKIYGQRSAA